MDESNAYFCKPISSMLEKFDILISKNQVLQLFNGYTMGTSGCLIYTPKA